MAVMTVSDVFVPQVLADNIRLWMYNNTALLGSPAVRQLNPDWSRGGNTVTFPTISASLTAETLPVDDATTVTAQELTMSSVTATVLSKIIPIATTGTMLEDIVQPPAPGMPSIMDEITAAVGGKLRDAIDLSLVSAAEATANATIACDTTFDISKLTKARQTYGDKMNGNFVLIVHSAVYNDILNMDATRNWSTWGGSPVAVTGNVGQLSGVPVIVSDNISVSDGTYTNLLVPYGGLGFAFKRQISYVKLLKDEDRQRHEFTCRYIVKLLKYAALDGAVEITCTASA